MKTFNLFIFLALSLPSLLTAQTIDSGVPFFRCATQSNKVVELLKEGDTIIYRFGQANSAPELELARPSREVSISIGTVSGNELSNSITFANGEYRYRIISSVNRIADTQTPRHGVMVMRNSSRLAYIACIPGSVGGSLLDVEQ